MTGPTPNRKCAVCGVDYYSNRQFSVTCSIPCRRRYDIMQRIERREAAMAQRNCVVCQATFKPRTINHSTCSERCSRLRNADRWLAYKREKNHEAINASLRQDSAYKRGEVQAPVSEFDGYHKCPTCVHGRLNRDAAMGWECAVAAFTRCQPLSPAPKLYKRKPKVTPCA